MFNNQRLQQSRAGFGHLTRLSILEFVGPSPTYDLPSSLQSLHVHWKQDEPAVGVDVFPLLPALPFHDSLPKLRQFPRLEVAGLDEEPYPKSEVESIRAMMEHTKVAFRERTSTEHEEGRGLRQLTVLVERPYTGLNEQ